MVERAKVTGAEAACYAWGNATGGELPLQASGADFG